MSKKSSELKFRVVTDDELPESSRRKSQWAGAAEAAITHLETTDDERVGWEFKSNEEARGKSSSLRTYLRTQKLNKRVKLSVAGNLVYLKLKETSEESESEENDNES
jgi:hypothetical protein